MKTTIKITEVQEVLEDLINDYMADIEGCSGDELLRYDGAINALTIAISRVRSLKYERK